MKLTIHHAPLGPLLVLLLATSACDDGAPGAPTSGSASASAPSSASAAAVGAPKIVAVEPVFEFGKVKLGATVEHVFKVRNEGTAPLKIARAKGS